MASSSPVRRNSAYGHPGPIGIHPKSTKSVVRRTQSMRYTQKQNNVNNNGVVPLILAKKVASISSGIVNNENNKLANNGLRHQSKANGKLSAFNFIIAKDLEHFKNEKVFRVLIVGSPDSGKTSLISQFSMFLEEHHLENPPKANANQLLILHFREIISLDCCFPRSPITLYQPDAYIVLYAVNDRESFESANKLIKEIHKWDDFDSKPVILVANKTDLVRSRTVAKQEGRQLATSNNCKYIETSCAISHNIDFLLAGIGAQINLKNPEKAKESSTRKPNLFKRFLRKAVLNKSKSCDNLHVL